VTTPGKGERERADRAEGVEQPHDALRRPLGHRVVDGVTRSAFAREQAPQRREERLVVSVLDCGRLMTAESGGLSAFDHALNATLMMGHVASRAGDQIGLAAFDRQVRAYLPPIGGRRATQRLIATAYDLQPQLVETDYGVAFDLLARRVRKRALVVLFTQIVDDVSAQSLLRFMRGLPRRHLPLCVLLRDGDVDGLLEGDNARGDAGWYIRGAAAETVLWRDRLVRELKAGGAHVLQPLPQDLTPALVTRYLQIKAQQLL